MHALIVKMCQNISYLSYLKGTLNVIRNTSNSVCSSIKQMFDDENARERERGEGGHVLL